MYLEDIIELETAFLARKRGFPQLEETSVYNYSDISTWDKLRDDSWELSVGEAAVESVVAPTQAQLHTWIRNNHGLVVEVSQFEGDYFFLVASVSDHEVFLEDEEYYDTYEKAFERGLFAALTEIKSPMKVSFDYDGCLEISTIEAYAKSLVDKGIEVWIVTSRVTAEDYLGSDPNIDLEETLDRTGILYRRVVYLGDKRTKATYFKEHTDFVWHLEDAWDDVKDINADTPVKAISNFGNEDWQEQCEALLND